MLATLAPLPHHWRMSSEVPCDGPCNSRYRKARAEYEAALAAYDPLDPDLAP